MPRYMLDTDISSYIVKRSNQPVLKRLQRIAIDQVCISVITEAELLYGVEISPRRQTDKVAVDAFLRHLAVLEFPAQAGVHYADIRADLKKRGLMIGANDLLIAAHARCLDLTLVTNNVDEFGRVRSLAIENWAR
ncbi:MAG: PIN domain-containing protein [Alphaproteobacteria bacterium]|nr:PIN domain-containing protein [Alphaproteobacteria bacterium]MDE2111660.1 PIN domain-containing protein [Alphaproteobacteria bacterium]MDE2492816.1 PIN domain-containing protein [Alphaproteobacteria bacterium]